MPAMSRLTDDDVKQSLMAEINELKDLLATIPADRVIERKSLEARLESVTAALASARADSQ